MAMAARDLIARLGPDGGLRCRTGIVLVPPADLPSIADFGARHGMDTIAYAEAILREMSSESQFASLSVDAESERLRRIADNPSGSPVLLIAQFDVALARLRTMDRDRLWQTVLTYLTQTRHGLLLAMPSTAHRLLPGEKVREELLTSGRITPSHD